jgi:preprotein translocase subunit SecE
MRLTWVVSVVTVIAALVLFGLDALFSIIITMLIGLV